MRLTKEKEKKRKMASEHVMQNGTIYQESRSNSIRAHTIHTDALNLRI